jgi:hypothetical protein
MMKKTEMMVATNWRAIMNYSVSSAFVAIILNYDKVPHVE